ncbi:uncharacterized protein K452DRAFT_308663 [Aplosporella prunicola CBS 121167]|uniref:Extracellular serine-rich protein n=1 Tax=Aplosporella prunicola CBS 121167 TaxID=1176127 RepID=A0A6A6BGB6_9PEZI|nr:uncharacterized protein K452DRAFT_308663 [Aplosporella prunicola CBS 121167]KAF2141561.1 hypothetical protein K452DRAFT_308663 [Aplosporella prunicola CBS 121167]
MRPPTPIHVLLAVLLVVTPPAKAAIHTVSVGRGGTHEFIPNTTYAAAGDTVVFDFFPTNHSVIRTQYCGAGDCNPCVPWELYFPDRKGEGFASGNFEVGGYDQRETWNLTVNDTAPIWFYCNALDSCTPNGMVGVINPPPNATIASQIRVAKSARYQLAPGEPWPAEGSSKPSSSSSSSSSLSGGAIAGIVVGVVAFVVLAAALFFFIGRTHTYARMFRHPAASTTTGHAPSDAGLVVGAGGGMVAGPGAANPWFQQQQQSMPSPPHSPPPPGMGAGGLGYQEKQLTPQRWSDSSAFSGSYPAMRGASPPPTVGEDVGQGMTFVGYNRQTGAPEFVAEVSADHEVVEMGRGTIGRGGGGGGVGEVGGQGAGGGEVGGDGVGGGVAGGEGGDGATGAAEGRDGLNVEVAKGDAASVVTAPVEMDAEEERKRGDSATGR